MLVVLIPLLVSIGFEAPAVAAFRAASSRMLRSTPTVLRRLSPALLPVAVQICLPHKHGHVSPIRQAVNILALFK